MKIIDIADHLKPYAIIKGLVTNFQQSWSEYLGKVVSSDAICFNSGNSLLSGQQVQSGFGAFFRCVM